MVNEFYQSDSSIQLLPHVIGGPLIGDLTTCTYCTYVSLCSFLYVNSEVVQLLSLNFGRDETTADTVERTRPYLVILEVDGIMAFSSWPKDKTRHINTSVETAIAVADLQVLLLIIIIEILMLYM